MVWNSDFGNWLSGGSRNREHVETREAWARVQSLWLASPLAKTDVAFDTAIATVNEAAEKAGCWPAVPIRIELSIVADFLLGLENVGALEVTWPIIEGDVSAAVEFRQMLRRRERWALEYPRHVKLIRDELSTAYAYVFKRLPPSCFGKWSEDDGLFSVPLVELIEEPANVVEALMWAHYSDGALALDLFRQLRREFEHGLLEASGFPPDTDIEAHRNRIVIPTKHRNQNARDLVETYLGRTPYSSFLEMAVPFEIPEEARFEHAHIVGGTGHGKTQLMQRMIYADLVAAQKDKRSVVVIDSQGDMLARLTRLALFDPAAPNSLADRLVVIDPADVEFPASLNLFDLKLDRLTDYRPVDRERVLNGVVELYETFFGELLGAELTQKQGVIFKYLARLMLTIPGATIHTLMQLMEDGRPFKPYMDQLDGSARYFFQTEFFHPGFAATKKQILRRLWGVLATPAFERMFAQKDNKLDLFQAMQDGKIVLINTAKDLLKQEGSQLFGRFFIAMLAQAALERSTVAPEDRTPTFVYVDEAQEYFGDDVETILNQARKYRVGLTVAHQALDQLSPRLRAVLHANTAMKCAGGVSAKDARGFADELHATPDFIESMKRRQGKTEFAVWLRQQTPHAIRLAVPLGFVERQATLTEEAYDGLLARNRAQYCGTLANVARLSPAVVDAGPVAEPRSAPAVAPVPEHIDEPTAQPVPELYPRPEPSPRVLQSGKGGPKHRYLQQLVKGLGEEQGFRCTIEAPLPGGGQVDVLLEREGLAIPVEVSVTTPVEWELANIRKCLEAGYPTVAVVLAKTQRVDARYREAILGTLNEAERERVVLLSPEDLPDFIASFAPSEATAETVVRGYRVRVVNATRSGKDAQQRRDTIGRLMARAAKPPSQSR